MEGQNSFQDYFREILAPVVRAYAEDVFDQEGEDTVFFINFFSDALIAAMLRWLSSRNCMPPIALLGFCAKVYWAERNPGRQPG